MAQESEINQMLAPYGAFVVYSPLRSEVHFRDYVSLPQGATVYEIASHASLDPHHEAQRAMAAVGTVRTAVLMPGRLFDAAGTRHGQGGGWYDRFLTEVPKEWQRIGFCFDRQFSDTPLHRQPWDQQMDAVVVVGNDVRIFRAKRV